MPPIFDKNKNSSTASPDSNSAFSLDVIKHNNLTYELINSKIKTVRTEYQGDGIEATANGGTFKLSQPGTGSSSSLTGSASGYIINDNFNRADNTGALGVPTIGISGIVWKNKKGIWGTTANNGSVFSQSKRTGASATDYATTYTGNLNNIVLYGGGISKKFVETGTLTYKSVTSELGLIFRSNRTATDFYAIKQAGLSLNYVFSHYVDYLETVIQTFPILKSPTDVLSITADGDTISFTVNGSSSGSATSSFINTSNTSTNTYYGLFTNELDASSLGKKLFEDYSVLLQGAPTATVTATALFPSGVRLESFIPANNCDAAIFGDDGVPSYIHISEETGAYLQDFYALLKNSGSFSAYGDRFYFNTQNPCNSIGNTYLLINGDGLFLIKDDIVQFGLDANTGDIILNNEIFNTDSSDNNGSQGISGLSGDKGESGTPGDSGLSGLSGISGRSGISGLIGTSGVSGISGLSGLSGGSGLSGLSGWSGLSGISGTIAILKYYKESTGSPLVPPSVSNTANHVAIGNNAFTLGTNDNVYVFGTGGGSGDSSFTVNTGETSSSGSYGGLSTYDVAISKFNKAIGTYSTTIGGSANTTNGKFGYTTGLSNTGNSYAGLRIGYFGLNDPASPESSPVDGSRIFAIGNGTSVKRSDAFFVTNTGKVGASSYTGRDHFYCSSAMDSTSVGTFSPTLGSYYKDNPVIAWGHVEFVGPNPVLTKSWNISAIGRTAFGCTAAGDFSFTLISSDPTDLLTFVTPEPEINLINPCNSTFNVGNAVGKRIMIFNNAGLLVDKPFNFHVLGRP